MARKSNHTGLKIFLILLILALIAGSAYMVKYCIDMAGETPAYTTDPGSSDIELPTPPTTEETEPPTTVPVPEHVVSTATIASTGDLLMHKPVMDSCYSNGGYNFDEIFQYVKPYVEETDYAMANLETTLYGSGKPYAGYPMFNCPDEIVDGVKNAGFDMLLTANNHSFDTGFDGYIRTLDVVREKGVATLGTMKDETEPKWVIQDINGIKIGMLCYTYETSDGTGAYPALNGNPMYNATYENINCFRESDPDAFFAEVKQYLAEMEEAGAEATMLFIHWGVEYQLKQNEKQSAIAQGLCDLGIDVIVGGHPHVIQPMDLLESTVDPEHKTVVLYSMGNAVSNQLYGNLQSVKTAHTEDGVLFSVTFEKYSDGTVYLAETNLLPTWNFRRTFGGRNEYNILPLDIDREEEWMTLFEFSQEYSKTSAKNSYDRTMAIVGEGLAECQTYLAEAKTAREEYYYDLAWHPEKFATEATQTTEEATEAASENVTEATP